jgi:hypothetical protein
MSKGARKEVIDEVNREEYEPETATNKEIGLSKTEAHGSRRGADLQLWTQLWEVLSAGDAAQNGSLNSRQCMRCALILGFAARRRAVRYFSPEMRRARAREVHRRRPTGERQSNSSTHRIAIFKAAKADGTYSSWPPRGSDPQHRRRSTATPTSTIRRPETVRLATDVRKTARGHMSARA